MPCIAQRPVPVLELLEHRRRQLGLQILPGRRLELVRGRAGPLEVLVQLLDRQLEVVAAGLKRRALDQRDRALQDRCSFLLPALDATDSRPPPAPASLKSSARQRVGAQFVAGPIQELGSRVITAT